MLTYTAGHINYGGRVTDDWDRRCLLCLLSDYYTTAVLNDRCIFDESGAYKQVIDTRNSNDLYISFSSSFNNTSHFLIPPPITGTLIQ